MRDDDALLELLVQVVLLSLLAIGGVNTILPELHRLMVTDGRWLSDSEFTSLYALAQAAPGPNVIFITLLGWQLAGLAGALSATVAICGPSFVLAYLVARLAVRRGEAGWFRLLRRGLVPLTAGLMMASAWLLTEAAAQSEWSYAITAVTAVVLLGTRLNPLWLLASAAGLGAAGFT